VAFEVAQQLRLEAQGLSDEAPALRLRILEERFDERPLTITSGARVGEFELITTVRFDLLAEDGTPLLEPQTLITDALYLRDRGQLLGSREEARTLRREMVQRLARRMLQAAMVKAAP
jgi:outer membrane lipopolysaccharide assembly protein LptE/RlpB